MSALAENAVTRFVVVTAGGLVAALGIAPARAQGPVPLPPALTATRCADCVVKIDGQLDDEIWSVAPPGEGFVQQQPKPMEPASQRTTVQVAFDATAIYVAVYAHDEQPDEILAPLGRRDTEPVPSDWVRVAFDSYCDRRTAYEFSVNPAGTKVDALVTGGSNRDLTWDAVWEVAVGRVGDGWIAEYRIPFSALRFNGAGADWGFQVTRLVGRDTEIDVWAPVLQSDGQAVARYGALTGLRELEAPMTVQLVPYARTDLSSPVADGARWSRRDMGLGARVGGDVKALVTSSLTLDATILPDFGQVEADPSVVNLTGFETFFKERRPFFIEGVDILKFGLGIGNGDLGQDTLFYSRRVGGLPYRADVHTIGDDDVSRLGSSTEIFGAAKLVGKTAGGTSLAFLEAYTGPESATMAWEPGAGRPGRELVAPGSNYFIARTQQDFRDGHSSVGAIVTNVVRDTASMTPWRPTDEDTRGANPLVRTATTAGLDASHRSMDDQWQLSANLAVSDLRGSAGAIDLVQQSAPHRFQRVDNGHVTYDPTRTSLQGYAVAVQGGKFGGEPWQFGLFGIARSPGFDSNDLGYMTRADELVGVFWANYSDYGAGRFFRKIQLNTNWAFMSTTNVSEPQDRMGNIDLYLQLNNYWAVELGGIQGLASRDVSRLRGGPATNEPGYTGAWFWVRSNDRLPVWAEVNTFGIDQGGSRRYQITPAITLRPTPRLNITLGLDWQGVSRDHQYVDQLQDGTQDQYVIGHLRQQMWSLTARADLAITPTLTLQVYASPFVSGGAFDRYRMVQVDSVSHAYDRNYAVYDNSTCAAAGLSAGDACFVHAYGDTGNGDASLKQFRSTTVLRWEYMPGSALFLVWSQDRTYENDPGGKVNLRRDLGRLFFDTDGNDVVLLKLSYFFSV